ncbi:PREDICTED: uncharacterized protein LOC105501059 isoform X2 [Colobus angolensis palliatus]|uniref:uncharacterized protein LOC105501059 isoform X2 n=1 Tax=Colobus angolensis palliatus TaxID=336983 RepID=UPI0005F3F8C3|nr:PREDICTED: uncharacterized protein LOC105501059 isoform X2 [Colobus angolensis palliatus]
MTRQPPPPCNRFLGPVSSNTDNPRRGCWARVAQATGRGLPGPLLPPASACRGHCQNLSKVLGRKGPFAPPLSEQMVCLDCWHSLLIGTNESLPTPWDFP